MLTTEADLIRCSSCVCGPASASPARWMTLSTDPVESSTPNSSGRARSCRGARHGCGPRASRPRPAAAARTPTAAPRGKLGACPGRALRAADTVQPMLGDPDRDRRQLRDLVPPRLRRVNALRLPEHVRARPAPLGPMLDDLVDLLGGSSRRCLPSCPGWPPRPRPDPFPPGRGGADGGSCDGGSDEFRELRFSRRSSSATRASSRWFASTSSPTRNNNAIAVSRSPSRIASASARLVGLC